LTSILEPILIFVMGAVVGTIVLAIFLPIIALQTKLTGG
jgi:type II secretory pathway component PulF